MQQTLALDALATTGRLVQVSQSPSLLPNAKCGYSAAVSHGLSRHMAFVRHLMLAPPADPNKP